MLDGEVFTYKARDVHHSGSGMMVPDEYYSKMMPSGMAPHFLNLKVLLYIFDMFLKIILDWFGRYIVA